MSRILPVLLVLALLAAWVRYGGGGIPGGQVGLPASPIRLPMEEEDRERARLALAPDGEPGDRRVSTQSERGRPPILELELGFEAQRSVDTELTSHRGASDPPEKGSTDPEPPEPLDGPVLRSHYPNGQLEFLCGQVLVEDGSWAREGDWEAWHENGQLHEFGAYRAGAEHGEWQWWYEDGQAMAIGSFVDGERDGRWTWWHENGQLMMEGSYQLGLRVGTWRAFDTDGTSGVVTAETPDEGD